MATLVCSDKGLFISEHTESTDTGKQNLHNVVVFLLYLYIYLFMNKGITLKSVKFLQFCLVIKHTP